MSRYLTFSMPGTTNSKRPAYCFACGSRDRSLSSPDLPSCASPISRSSASKRNLGTLREDDPSAVTTIRASLATEELLPATQIASARATIADFTPTVMALLRHNWPLQSKGGDELADFECRSAESGGFSERLAASGQKLRLLPARQTQSSVIRTGVPHTALFRAPHQNSQLCNHRFEIRRVTRTAEILSGNPTCCAIGIRAAGAVRIASACRHRH